MRRASRLFCQYPRSLDERVRWELQRQGQGSHHQCKPPHEIQRVPDTDIVVRRTRSTRSTAAQPATRRMGMYFSRVSSCRGISRWRCLQEVHAVARSTRVQGPEHAPCDGVIHLGDDRICGSAGRCTWGNRCLCACLERPIHQQPVHDVVGAKHAAVQAVRGKHQHRDLVQRVVHNVPVDTGGGGGGGGYSIRTVAAHTSHTATPYHTLPYTAIHCHTLSYTAIQGCHTLPHHTATILYTLHTNELWGPFIRRSLARALFGVQVQGYPFLSRHVAAATRHCSTL